MGGAQLFPFHRKVATFAVLASTLYITRGQCKDLPISEDPGATLSRIRDKVAEHLSQLPNYTCHEVIDRFLRPIRTGELRPYDRVEVEVAFVGQRELFARPGDTHFQEQPITELVRTGTIGNGVFGSIAASVFLEGAASFEYSGPAEMDGHNAYRYDFQVAQDKSHFVVKHNYTEATVPYRGSFWADSETYELLRIEITADQLPPDVAMAHIREDVRYTAVRIRDSAFLLPAHGEMEADDTSGNISRNDVTLQQCHEFTGESSITFGEPVDGSSSDRATKP